MNRPESVRRPKTTVGAEVGAVGGLPAPPCGGMRLEPLFLRIPLDAMDGCTTLSWPWGFLVTANFSDLPLGLPSPSVC
jgi:hypothetical protein